MKKLNTFFIKKVERESLTEVGKFDDAMKIPQQATPVFKGIIFDVYQWQQKMFDGSEATFEMLRRPNTVNVIATRGESIFVGEEEQPMKPLFYTLLGGRQEEGEDTLAAAKRELLEESGLVSDDWVLYKTYEPVTKIDWQIHTYVARECRKVSDPKLDPGERIEVKEVDFDTFLDIACSERFCGDELTMDLLRMRLASDSGEKLEAFKKLLIG